MSEVKFTKGNWQALSEECDKPYIRIRGTTPGRRYKVCNVLTPVYDGVHEREAIETRANASLIATAPEMYEMLDKLSSQLTDINAHAAVNQIEALLAKARGGK